MAGSRLHLPVLVALCAADADADNPQPLCTATPMAELASSFEEYAAWRDALAGAIVRLREWLTLVELLDGDAGRRLDDALDRLAEDRLMVAFVAEFSRGKSELINAIFFSEYGRRVLPSSAGRTTMCPTELLYDETLPPCIRALPIETRGRAGSTTDFKRAAGEWQVFPLDTDSPEGMLRAFGLVAETTRVPADEAQAYGLYDPDDPEQPLLRDADGKVEISRWRHAVINFPHPLLKQGLVILDTPGLNAIGAEPELTLALVPKAHAVLFVLAADTGVTKSDLAVWRLVAGEGAAARHHIAVLNKIDGLWDPLKTERELEREIARQAHSVGETLGLASTRVFPVSAQKGLVGKVTGDRRLLARSRLPQLEGALVDLLVPAKHRIVRDRTLAAIERVALQVRHLLDGRDRHVEEQLLELRGLHGKNDDAVQRLATRAEVERRDFEQHVRRLVAARSVLDRLTEKALAPLRRDALRRHVVGARERMCASLGGLRFSAVVRDFFADADAGLVAANEALREIERMTLGVQRSFAEQLGCVLSPPMAFNLDTYRAELAQAEAAARSQLGPQAALLHNKWTLIERFFDSVVVRVRDIFESAERDAEAWSGSLLPPLEAQLREQRTQLKRRAAAADRIAVARDSLRERIGELEDALGETRGRRDVLESLLDRCRRLAGPEGRAQAHGEPPTVTAARAATA